MFSEISHLINLDVYLQAWLELMDKASEDTDIPQITSNLEAQHRYLTWRAEKVGGVRI